MNRVIKNGCQNNGHDGKVKSKIVKYRKVGWTAHIIPDKDLINRILEGSVESRKRKTTF